MDILNAKRVETDFDIDLSKLDLSKLGDVEIDETHFYLKGTCEKCLEKQN